MAGKSFLVVVKNLVRKDRYLSTLKLPTTWSTIRDLSGLCNILHTARDVKQVLGGSLPSRGLHSRSRGKIVKCSQLAVCASMRSEKVRVLNQEYSGSWGSLSLKDGWFGEAQDRQALWVGNGAQTRRRRAEPGIPTF